MKRRDRVPFWLPGRIPSDELDKWMTVNGISINQLAGALGTAFATVQGWRRGYWTAPAWLEQRINEEAARPGGKLPFYGQHWPEEASATPLPQVSPPPLAAEPLPEHLASLPEAPDDLFAAPAADCEHCGAPLKPDGQCSWAFCPANAGEA